MSYQIDNVYTIEMAACTADQWKNLGEGHKDLFQEFGLGDFFCPVSTDNLNLKDVFKKSRIKFIRIMIQSCSSSNMPGPPPVASYVGNGN
jgi:hypothetical protein